ncbi:restriction endonuclease [Nocardia wallacei]|uniref:restriction endonuclease n=1 Tax=Nocardia wallacei TaxID=480035 RepID=UPI0024562946|nr:restriction endonuclease [Nocardia wallacei]
MNGGPLTSMPVWHGFLTPVLAVLGDGRVWKKRDLEKAVFDRLDLTAEQLEEVLPSGQARARNRIGWALSGLGRAELITKPARATYIITEAGRELHAKHPDGLDEKILKSLPAYQAYVPVKSGVTSSADTDDQTASVDPLEQIESGVARLHSDVAAELLKHLRNQPPNFLEQAVLDVLVAMGYGGTEQRATRIGGSGDGGVDGVIDQDPLGLDRVYVQAKRYGPENTVQRPAIQAFVGALQGAKASRGIFITTSDFSGGALDYANTINPRVILIDGQRLASLMIQYGVGVQKRSEFTVVQVDEDYFE